MDNKKNIFNAILFLILEGLSFETINFLKKNFNSIESNFFVDKLS